MGLVVKHIHAFVVIFYTFPLAFHYIRVYNSV